jgi:putative phosphotransacetylase
MTGRIIINQANLKTLICGVIRQFESLPYIPVGISNRHIHLSGADLELLFGPAYQLTPVKDLLPGQYASKETVRIAGKKGKLENVRILGPVRGETQFEPSLTDTFALGVPSPINESGDLRGAGTVTIENPVNGASIERACSIVALRHVHLSVETAEKFDLKDKQLVSLSFENGVRDITFGRVLVRVSPNFTDEIHLDIDEANAGGIQNGNYGLIIPKAGR